MMCKVLAVLVACALLALGRPAAAAPNLPARISEYDGSFEPALINARPKGPQQRAWHAKTRFTRARWGTLVLGSATGWLEPPNSTGPGSGKEGMNGVLLAGWLAEGWMRAESNYRKESDNRIDREQIEDEPKKALRTIPRFTQCVWCMCPERLAPLGGQHAAAMLVAHTPPAGPKT